MPVVRHAPAKINWFLEILGKREDGFHEISTVMQSLDLCDTLTFTLAGNETLELTCDNPSLDCGPDNLVMRAAAALRRITGAWPGARIHLEKDIPIGAGLGGGSSDAAATLVGLNELWKLDLRPTQLMLIAAILGSDVPYFVGEHLQTSLALCEGRGERVTPLDGQFEQHLVIVWPGFPISTAEVYQSGAIDLVEPRRPAPVEKTPVGFQLSAPPPAFVFNRLEAAALAISPELSEAMDRMADVVAPRSVHVSGSGSSMFAAVEDRETALSLRTRLRLAFPRPAVVERALAMA